MMVSTDIARKPITYCRERTSTMRLVAGLSLEPWNASLMRLRQRLVFSSSLFGSLFLRFISRKLETYWVVRFLSKCLTASDKDNLQIHEDKERGIHVRDLSEVYVSTLPEVMTAMHTGTQSRVIASTSTCSSFCNSHVDRHERTELAQPHIVYHCHSTKEPPRRIPESWQTGIG